MAYLIQVKKDKDYETMTSVPKEQLLMIDSFIKEVTTKEAGKNAEKPIKYQGRLARTIRGKKALQPLIDITLMIYPTKIVSKKKTGK